MKPLIYVASKYSAPTDAEREANAVKSFHVADQIVAAGGCVALPLAFHWWKTAERSYDEWMELDDALLVRCDALLRVPGASKGADIEVRRAEEMGIPVFHSVENLGQWIIENYHPRHALEMDP